MAMSFIHTDTEHLKVTVTGDNDVRFKVPQNSKLDLVDLTNYVHSIMQNSTIFEFEFTLRGKRDDRGKICFYHQQGSKKNRKRIFIGSVII